MRAAAHQPLLALCPAPAAQRGEAPAAGGNDGPAGLLAHHAAGHGQPETDGKAAGRGLSSGQKTGAASDAGDGHLGHLSQGQPVKAQLSGGNRAVFAA